MAGERISDDKLAEFERAVEVHREVIHPSVIQHNRAPFTHRVTVLEMDAMLSELRSLRLSQSEREALEVLADRNRCTIHGCADVLCTETQAGVAVLDKLLAAKEGT